MLTFRLFSKRWRSPSLDRTASFSVANAIVESQVVDACVTPTALSVTARPQPLLQSHPRLLPRCPWSSRLACSLPLTGLVIRIRMVAASGPLAPPRITVLRVLLRGRSRVPVVPGGHLDSRRCVGQQTVCPRTEMAYTYTIMCNRELKRHAHTRWSPYPCIARAGLQWCEGVGATQKCVLDEDKWTISWRLTLPSTSHRELEPLETHASIVYLWVLFPTAYHPFPLFR